MSLKPEGTLCEKIVRPLCNISPGYIFVLIHVSGAIAVVGLELAELEGVCFFFVKGCILVLEHPLHFSARIGIVKTLLQPSKAEVQQYRNDGKTAP